MSGGEIVEQPGDHVGDRGPLGLGERDVGEQVLAVQLVDDCVDSVVPADPQVVPLGDVPAQDNLGTAADTSESR